MEHRPLRKRAGGCPTAAFRGRRWPRNRCRGCDDDNGSVLIEFALVLPIFAAMLFGMIQFGLVFNGWTSLRNSAQTGARLAAMNEVVDGASTYDCTPPDKLQPISFTCPSTCPDGVTAQADGYDFGTADLLCYIDDVVGEPTGTTASSSNPVLIGLLAQGDLVAVCSQTQAELFTGFFPSMTLSSAGTFYIEVQGQGELINFTPNPDWQSSGVNIQTGVNDTLDFLYSPNAVTTTPTPETLTIPPGTYSNPQQLATTLADEVEAGTDPYSADPPDVILVATPDDQGVMLETVNSGSNVSLQVTQNDADSMSTASTLGFDPSTLPGGVFENYFLESYPPTTTSTCAPTP
jgi:hypothetical protein